jgi:hypothetical protein
MDFRKGKAMQLLYRNQCNEQKITENISLSLFSSIKMPLHLPPYGRKPLILKPSKVFGAVRTIAPPHKEGSTSQAPRPLSMLG